MRLTASMIWLSMNFDFLIQRLFRWKKSYFAALWSQGTITGGQCFPPSFSKKDVWFGAAPALMIAICYIAMPRARIKRAGKSLRLATSRAEPAIPDLGGLPPMSFLNLDLCNQICFRSTNGHDKRERLVFCS